ncbi:MAG TPA: septum formation initiator family protein [Ignavibacteria bacterium]|nr:septum formation initiator family protein [Ignavibacteria bacterium]
MDSSDQKDGFLKVIFRFIKYNLRIVFVIIFFIGLISFALFGNKGLIQRMELESERKELEGSLNAEINKTKELQKQIEELKNSEAKQEQVAREKYGMTKEGEKIYKIIIDSTK